MKKKCLYIKNFVLVFITVVTVPFLYLNCGKSDFNMSESSSINVDSDTGIGIQIYNGAGALVANGGSLCAGSADLTQSRTVTIAIATTLAADTYYCRRTRPSADNDFWNCENTESLGGSSGSFGRIPDSDNTEAALGYSGLSNGTYELEISAEGEGDTPWTTSVVPVSFVVEPCSSVAVTDDDLPTSNNNVTTTTQSGVTTTTLTGVGGNTVATTTTFVTEPCILTCGDTDCIQSGNQKFDCGDWTYNMSASDVLNPSRSNCCVQPTVTTTTLGGTSRVSDNSVATTTTQKKVTTTTLSGVGGNNATTTTFVTEPCILTCGDTDCIQSGNQKFDCGDWTYNMSASDVLNPSRSNCCIQPPTTCSPDGTVVGFVMVGIPLEFSDSQITELKKECTDQLSSECCSQKAEFTYNPRQRVCTKINGNRSEQCVTRMPPPVCTCIN